MTDPPAPNAEPGPSLPTPPQGPPRAAARRGTTRALAVIVGVLVVAGGLLGVHVLAPYQESSNAPTTIPVVAAENFWGSLLVQLGGVHASVYTIVADPNADPHDYESTTADAVAVANARLVVENGAGYDAWCQKLIDAGNISDRIVLNVATVVGQSPGDNPHFWYDAAFVNATVSAMIADLSAIAPSDATYFAQQGSILRASLDTGVFGPEAEIRAAYGGTPVGATESLVEYLANSTGLDLVSPPAFMDAVAEGNDPPASSVTTFEDQLSNGSVRVLIVNAQTVTPLTDQMRSLAVSDGIPVVEITETVVPADVTFQVWMAGELHDLASALASATAGG